MPISFPSYISTLTCDSAIVLKRMLDTDKEGKSGEDGLSYEQLRQVTPAESKPKRQPYSAFGPDERSFAFDLASRARRNQRKKTHSCALTRERRYHELPEYGCWAFFWLICTRACIGFISTLESTSLRTTSRRFASSLRACYAMSGADISCSAIGLRACYAMPSIDLPYGAVCLRACYAMSGTDVAYVATRSRTANRCVTYWGSVCETSTDLRHRYAVSGSEKACGLSAYARAMRCPVLTYRMVPLPECSFRGSRRSVPLSAYAPKSNTRNRIFSTNCTRNAVSCIRVCSVRLSPYAPPTPSSVLILRTVLPAYVNLPTRVLGACYEMSDTDIAHALIWLLHVLREVRY
eukprot:1673145-Rhodomonas_salina.5